MRNTYIQTGEQTSDTLKAEDIKGLHVGLL